MVIKRYIRGFAFVLMILSIVLIGMAAAPSITVTFPINNPDTVTVNYVNVTVATTGPTGIVYLSWDSGANETMNGAGNNFYLNKSAPINKPYNYIVYANDTTLGNWSSSGNRVVNVNAPTSPPSVTAFEPSNSNVNSIVNVSQVFNVTFNQDANVSWKIGGLEVQNLSASAGTKSEFMNTSNVVGIYTVTATAFNGNGSSSPQAWTWNVTSAPGLGPVTGLTPSARGTTWINWTWTNPGGAFDHTIVKINGTFQTNTSYNYYNYTGLIGTPYTISLQTVDTSGVADPTIVSNQSTTLNTPAGSNVNVQLTGTLKVIFSQVNAEGNTSVNQYSTLQNAESIPAFSTIGNYYYISTDSSFYSGNVTVELVYNPGGFNESNIKLYHWNSITTTWDDITTYRDIINDKVGGNVTSFSPFVVGAPPRPIISNPLPNTGTSITTIGTESQTFKISVTQDASITWKFSGSTVNSSSVLAGVPIEFTYAPSAAASTYNFSVTATNTNGSDTASWMWTVRPKTYATGNRVWDANKEMSTTYTWNPMSFYAFYYDLDDNVGSESLQIQLFDRTDRNIERGTLIYNTSTSSVAFKNPNWGRYNVIGFMAAKYFAGYTTETKREISDTPVSTINYQQLHKILADDNDARTLYSGGTLTLGEGYVLKLNDIGSGRVAMLTLLKDGGVVDTSFRSQGETYVFSKKVGSISSLPIIAIRIENVFQGREADAIFFKGLFQISESYTSVTTGNKYGIMEIIDSSATSIKMENRNAFLLAPGSVTDIMGDIKIIVAKDESVLRFAPMVKKSGIYEVRGTVSQNNSPSEEWNPMNFEGFYYNLDEDVGSEKLTLARSNRDIPKDSLVYSTSPQSVSFKYSSWGRYRVVGFMAEKYFAGYSVETNAFKDVPKSAINFNQIHKILIDDDTQRIIYSGSTLTLNDGYVVKIKDVNMGAGSPSVWLSLLKDGNEIFDDFKNEGDTFAYAPSKVGSVSNLPIILVRIDKIFRGKEATAAFVKGVFQISESYTSVRGGDRFGVMQVSEVSDTKIAMSNPNVLTLPQGSTVDVMGNIKFKVANSNDIRFYPFVLANGSAIAANQLAIDISPASPMVRDTLAINVTAGTGTPIESAEVSFDNNVIGTTNSTGRVDYVLTRSGTHTITATKLGYEKATKTIQVEEYRDIALKFELPAVLDQGFPIPIKVISNGTAIPGATVTLDSAVIGTTDTSGMLTYTFNISGTHNLGASKQGYISVVREITIRMPFTEFKALDINITPPVIYTGHKFTVRANISNVGTKEGTLPVELMINNTAVENKNATLAPGATQEINFTREMELPVGNYTIELLGQKKVVEVQEGPLSFLLLGTIITGLGVILIYVYTSKDKITIDSLKNMKLGSFKLDTAKLDGLKKSFSRMTRRLFR